ncbi:MAG: fibrobacter succinogenes major paralogous domain-containing protein [Chlorobiaceae bacterium]
MRNGVYGVLKSFAIWLLILYLISFKDSNSYADNRIYLKETVVDIDGNVYNTLKIGNYVWMLENLNVSKYRNGDPIKNITDYDLWDNATTGAWAFYENNKKYSKSYGRLYNWYAINDSRGLAPKGWHIASFKEWRELIDYLGGDMVAGDLIKFYFRLGYLLSEETINSELDNVFGGSRYLGGAFCFRRYNGYFWTSTKKDIGQSFYVNINYINSKVYVDYDFIKNGLSVKCVKDSD